MQVCPATPAVLVYLHGGTSAVYQPSCASARYSSPSSSSQECPTAVLRRSRLYRGHPETSPDPTARQDNTCAHACTRIVVNTAVALVSQCNARFPIQQHAQDRVNHARRYGPVSEVRVHSINHGATPKICAVMWVNAPTREERNRCVVQKRGIG